MLLGQNTNGSINTPFDIQNWTFSALAGEQVELHINNETSSGLLYSLSGPNGFVGFTNLTGDSPLVNLTQNGAYTLSVQGLNGATGNYSFVLNPTTQTNLPLNSSINGTLVGSGQAQLFTIDVPTPQALGVSLDDQSSADSNEMYLRFGAPPTRETFDYRYSNASAPDQSILVPHAAAGTWYVLVYAANVPVQSNFALSTTGRRSAGRALNSFFAGKFRTGGHGDHRRRVPARSDRVARRPGQFSVFRDHGQRCFVY